MVYIEYMASYLEIYELSGDGNIVNKVTAAVAVAAHGILNEQSPTAPRKAWAEAAIIDPTSKTKEMIWYLLADNVSASKATILAANDAAILAAVDEAVDKRIAAS